jgi:hypothetical protein
LDKNVAGDCRRNETDRKQMQQVLVRASCYSEVIFILLSKYCEAKHVLNSFRIRNAANREC